MIVVLLLGVGPALCQLPPRDPAARLAIPREPGTFGYIFENAFPGLAFDSPVAVVSPPGETRRLFVVEQSGRIRVIPDLDRPTVETFLDLRSGLVTGGEQGLLGLAFHPGYARNGRFFVFRTVTATTRGNANRLHDRLSEFRVSEANPQRAATAETILFQQYDQAGNHNGGDLAFGPDGYLYVSLGDEGGGNDQFLNGQKIDRDFFAGLLRLDVDRRPGSLPPNPHPANEDFPDAYRIPADNPYVGATTFLGRPVNAAAVRTEFHAVGLRNPWRFSFDSGTGELWIGDVGQGARESVLISRSGANHGWAFREGTVAGPIQAPAGFTTNPDFRYVAPVYAYSHGTGPLQGNSITGGVVYRGTRLGQLTGAYVFSDYVRGNVWTLRRQASGPPLVARIAGQAGIAGFGADPRQGDILAAHHSGGRILRLRYNDTFTGEPLPPTLADTGAFDDLAALRPKSFLVPYEVNQPFWSDHAFKQRWFFLPGESRAAYSSTGPWGTPPGAVWMKHFEIEMRPGDPASRKRLETRFLVRHATGLHGLTYRWTSPDNAVLVPDAGEEEILRIGEGPEARTQLWRYPSRAECLACHTPAAGGTLSFHTAQLNRPGADGHNQITALAAAGYLENLPGPVVTQPAFRSVDPLAAAPATAAAASLEARARAYLDVNCSSCHQPGGPGLSRWDARATTPLDHSGLLHGPLNDSFGHPDNRVVVPGDPERSVLLQRMRRRGSGQMPPLASSVPDAAGADLVEAWIRSLADRLDFGTWAAARLGDTSGAPAPDRDTDLDGASDFLEYLTGTDPKASAEAWIPEVIRSGGPMRLRLRQPANVAFRIETSSGTPAGPWVDFDYPANALFYPSVARDVEILLEPHSGARYFRVRLSAPWVFAP